MDSTADKSRTGVPGFDEISGGGLPSGCTTVVSGGPGCGKTIFALQSLIRGAAAADEASVFVCFEESPERVRAHAAGLGWDPDAADVHLLDAQIDPAVIQAGDFDLLGLLASVQATVDEVDARRVVLDGIDVYLDLIADDRARRRELFRLRDWLDARDLTTLITAKTDPDTGELGSRYSFLEFLCESVIELRLETVGSTAVRMLQIPKHRGGAHAAYQCPFVIGDTGIRIADLGIGRLDYPVSNERISTGVDRLDRMFGGGYFRNSAVVLSGTAGTAKTTLAVAFTVAAAERGEKTLLVSFDEAADQIVRNAASVGLDLAAAVDAGLAELYSVRSRPQNPHEHLLNIEARWDEIEPSALVIDPITALSSSGSDIAEEMALHLVDLARRGGMTVVATALTDEHDFDVEGTQVGMSTVADTWIHLTNVAQAGERNRALAIVKSRGMSHSHQVRELVLTDEGITLEDVYSYEGEVLMGTMRWQREQAEEAAAEKSVQERNHAMRQAEAQLIRARSEREAISKEVALQENRIEHLREQAEREEERREQARERTRELRHGADDRD